MKTGFFLSAAVFADDGDITEPELDEFIDDLIHVLEARDWHAWLEAHRIGEDGEVGRGDRKTHNSGLT